MHALNENDYKLFKSICKLPQKSLMKTLYQILKKKYDKIIVTQDYIFAQGEIPIALVAHMDTVHKENVKDFYEYYDKEIISILSVRHRELVEMIDVEFI